LYRPDSYGLPLANKPEIVSSNNYSDNYDSHQYESTHSPSPFVGLDKTQDILDEKNSWFLVQLPTRLPPLKKDFSSKEHIDSKLADGDDNTTIGATASSSDTNVLSNLSDVVVPPVATSNFDQGYGVGGRIGKIVVYKSGKTVLFVDSPDAKKISMEVNEGLTCSFHQQAVVVDAEEGNYISLGNVNKSIVISPDLADIITG